MRLFDFCLIMFKYVAKKSTRIYSLLFSLVFMKVGNSTIENYQTSVGALLFDEKTHLKMVKINSRSLLKRLKSLSSILQVFFMFTQEYFQ